MRGMEKAYSFRFYLTPEQESLLRHTWGCVRLVYNKALHERTQAWYESREKVQTHKRGTGYHSFSQLYTRTTQTPISNRFNNALQVSVKVPISPSVASENITLKEFNFQKNILTIPETDSEVKW